MAAVLDAGPHAWLSHTSGAAWWEVPGFALDPRHVSRRKGRGRRRTSLAIVHEITDVEARHVTVLDQVPVVRPELLAYQLCGSVHPLRAERAIDNLWSRRLVSGRSLRATLDDLAEQGRNGTTAFREILDRRGDDYVPPATNLEARFDQILREAGERPMRRQVDVGSDTAWIGRVDFLDDELPLIVEIQSERFHTALCDREADAARHAALEAAGFMVLEIWDTDIWHNRAAVVAAVRAARRTLRKNGLPMAG
jgi:very-short-patch-repair endonuclease